MIKKPFSLFGHDHNASFLGLFTVFMLTVGVSVFVISNRIYPFFKEGTVTVYGTSSSFEASNLAEFSINVSSTDSDKTAAIQNLNVKAQGIIDAAIDAGIEKNDIKTMNVSVYQERNWDPVTQESPLGDWRASNTISIKVREVERADELSTLFSSLDIESIYGPNFTTDTTDMDDSALLERALADAKNKADNIAQSSGKRVIGIKEIVEGSQYSNGYPVRMAMDGMGGGGSAAYEPGATQLVKDVTVTFYIK